MQYQITLVDHNWFFYFMLNDEKPELSITLQGKYVEQHYYKICGLVRGLLIFQ